MKYSQLCSYIAMITCTVFFISLYIYSHSINIPEKDNSTADRDGSSTVNYHKSDNLTYIASMGAQRIIPSSTAVSSILETHDTGNATWKEIYKPLAVGKPMAGEETDSTMLAATDVKKTESTKAVLKKVLKATATAAQSTEVRPQLLFLSASDKLKYFDWKFYQRTNPDLQSAGVVSETQLLEHFKNYGLRENRWCSPIEKPVEAACLRVIYVFPPKQFRYYCSSYPIFHPYSLTKRLQEKMAMFDWKFYLQHNPDLKSANIETEEQAAGHYKLYGYFDRRWSNATEQPTLGSCIRAKDVLTPSKYATICSEESIAKSDFTIFENSILRESSSSSSSSNISSVYTLDSDRSKDQDKYKLLQDKLKKFDWKFYLKSNPDLLAAGLKTKRDALKHYRKHGFKEKRFSSSIEAFSKR